MKTERETERERERERERGREREREREKVLYNKGTEETFCVRRLLL